MKVLNVCGCAKILTNVLTFRDCVLHQWNVLSATYLYLFSSSFQICKCLAPLSELVVDGYIMGILEADLPEDVKSVEFTSDQSWKIKGGDCPLTTINRSSDKSNHGNDVVIDLTFDTPKKNDQIKISNVNSNFDKDGPPVIDLTLSP